MPQPVHTSDLLALTRTIYGEARGEGQQGKIAVGWVVRNRAKEARRHRAGTGKNHPLFGDGSLEVACTARMQFSCRNLSEPNRKVILVKTLPDALDDGWFLDCLSAALDVILGFEAGPTCGSTHYHTAAVAPAWPRGKQPVRQIGSHRFFNDVDREGSRPHRQAARRVCARCP